jgi:hypothetical protein
MSPIRRGPHGRSSRGIECLRGTQSPCVEASVAQRTERSFRKAWLQVSNPVGGATRDKMSTTR